MKFLRVTYRRVIANGPEAGTKTVSFERASDPVPGVNITAEQKAAFNAGRLENPGNDVFDYLLEEGEADPAPLILRTQTSGHTTRVDHTGTLWGRRIGPDIPLRPFQKRTTSRNGRG